jgi:hypothetical protein
MNKNISYGLHDGNHREKFELIKIFSSSSAAGQ